MPAAADCPVYHLLITGKRNGHYKQIVGFVRVLDDAFTRDVLTTMTWSRDRQGYAFTNRRNADGRYKRVSLHRLVHQHYDGLVPPGCEIDHFDRDRANALPSNLQAVSRSVNAANRGRTRKNQSGYVGVSWNRRSQKWIARISKLGHVRYLGSFVDPVEGARAVNAAYREAYPQIPVPNPLAEPAIA